MTDLEAEVILRLIFFTKMRSTTYAFGARCARLAVFDFGALWDLRAFADFVLFAFLDFWE